MNSRQDTLPKRDNEALCAYLDGVMTGEERLKFEKRLAKSLRLQKALKEYTQLRLAVRSFSVPFKIYTSFKVNIINYHHTTTA